MTAEPWYFCTVPQLSSVVSCRACRKSENSIKILTLKRCVSGKKQCQKGRKTRRHLHYIRQTLPWWLRWERTYLQCRRPGFSPWVGKIPWRREWLPTPVFLPGEFHGQRNLVGYSPWCRKKSDLTEQLTLSDKENSWAKWKLVPGNHPHKYTHKHIQTHTHTHTHTHVNNAKDRNQLRCKNKNQKEILHKCSELQKT